MRLSVRDKLYNDGVTALKTTATVAVGIKHDQDKTQYDLVPWTTVSKLELCSGKQAKLDELIEALIWSLSGSDYPIRELTSELFAFTEYAVGGSYNSGNYFKTTTGVAHVMTFGAKKYGPHNWRNGMDWTRLVNATLRHLVKYRDGGPIDEESSLNHLFHACTNMLFLYTYELEGLGTDNRWKKKEKKNEEVNSDKLVATLCTELNVSIFKVAALVGTTVYTFDKQLPRLKRLLDVVNHLKESNFRDVTPEQIVTHLHNARVVLDTTDKEYGDASLIGYINEYPHEKGMAHVPIIFRRDLTVDPFVAAQEYLNKYPDPED